MGENLEREREREREIATLFIITMLNNSGLQS